MESLDHIIDDFDYYWDDIDTEMLLRDCLASNSSTSTTNINNNMITYGLQDYDHQLSDDQAYHEYYSKLEIEQFHQESYNNLMNLKPNVDHVIEAKDNLNSQPNYYSQQPADEERNEMEAQVELPSSLPLTKNSKKKTLSVHASELCISTWKCIGINPMDVVMKCYYAKRRIIYELLENTSKLKKKIEIRWDHISAMTVINEARGNMTIKIELSETPLFFREVKPIAGLHTIWEEATDFTQGNALTCRIHSIKFSPDISGKHRKELLDLVSHFELKSQSQFPTDGVSHCSGFPGENTSVEKSQIKGDNPIAATDDQVIQCGGNAVPQTPDLLTNNGQTGDYSLSAISQDHQNTAHEDSSLNINSDHFHRFLLEGDEEELSAIYFVHK